MRILAVDDEALGLEALTKSIKKANPEAEVVAFNSPTEALAYARENQVDVAILDIQMPRMLGTELGKKLKVINPAVSVIFATGYDSYMGDAFSLHATGYLLKPITPAKVKKELENLRALGDAYRQLDAQKTRKLRFQCFGNFEVYAGTDIVKFRYDKTKEILAYMVSRRGALCSNGEIVANVWDDESGHDSYLRVVRKDMIDTLKDLGAEDLIVVRRGQMAIASDMVECDYYDFLKGDPRAINSYNGEFMAQYSWGEFTNAEIEMSQY